MTFRITTHFSEWVKGYDLAQVAAKVAGINSLSRGVSINDPTKVCAVMTAENATIIEVFMKDNEKLIRASGHVLESNTINSYSQD